MKISSTALAASLTALAGLSVAQHAAAADPVKMLGRITVDSAISCAASVTSETSAIDLQYTVTQDNIDNNKSGTYTLTGGGDGSAKYLVSAGASDSCKLNDLLIQLPVIGTIISNGYETTLQEPSGQHNIPVNTYLSDVMAYSTAAGTGSGTRVPELGYGRTASQAQSNQNGGNSTDYITSMTTTNANNSSDTYGAKVTYTADAHYKTAGYGVAGYGAWPADVIKTKAFFGFINGAQSGAYVYATSASLDAAKSARVSIGAAVGDPYLGTALDAGGVINGETFSGTGTVTFTWS